MNKLYPLSSGETSVVKFLAQGFTKKEIASKIHRSEHTITEQTRTAYQKTGCHNLADITRWTISKIYGLNFTDLAVAIIAITLLALCFSQRGALHVILEKASTLIKPQPCIALQGC